MSAVDPVDPGRSQGPGSSSPDGAPDGPPAWLRDLAAKAREAAVPLPLRPPPGGGRPSAVLVLFGMGADGPDLLLVQRGPGLRRHSGQPAFPGGAIDESDAGPVPAALREAAEEAGVEASGVEVLAVLPDLFIARSGFAVTPVLAWWRRPVPVAPADPPEVTAVARVPLSELSDPRAANDPASFRRQRARFPGPGHARLGVHGGPGRPAAHAGRMGAAVGPRPGGGTAAGGAGPRELMPSLHAVNTAARTNHHTARYTVGWCRVTCLT